MHMKIVELLHHDHVVNHQTSSSFLTSVEEILNRIIAGYQLSRFNNTVIIHKNIGAIGEGTEFHCYNAEPGEQLAQNVLLFLDQCRQAGQSWAETPYQNKRITELFQQHIAADCLTITETPTGILATVRL